MKCLGSTRTKDERDSGKCWRKERKGSSRRGSSLCEGTETRV